MAHLKTQIREVLKGRLEDPTLRVNNVRVDPQAPAQIEDIPGHTLVTGTEAEDPEVAELDCDRADLEWAIGWEIRAATNQTNPLLPSVEDILAEATPVLFSDSNAGGLATSVRIAGSSQQVSEEFDQQITVLAVILRVRYSYDYSDPTISH